MDQRPCNIFKIAFVAVFFLVALRTEAQVAITEIMYDLPGADTGREWVEIKNTSLAAVDISHWKLLEENVHHGLTLAQGSPALSSGSLAVIADNAQKFLLDWPEFSGTLFDSVFSLSNSGETLILKNESLNIIDSVAYDAAMEASGTGESLQKISSGWAAHAPTPAQENEDDTPLPEEIPPDPVPEPPPPPSSSSSPEPLPEDLQDPPEEIPDDFQETPNDQNEPPAQAPPPGIAHVQFNEIMYDLPGADTEREWIELYNAGDAAADLTDWRLSENTTDHHLELAAGSPAIEPGDFALVVSDYEKFKIDWPDFAGTVFDSMFSLSNTAEALVLKDPSFAIADMVLYPAEIGAAGDGKTLSRFDDTWRAALATPGMVNSVPSQDEENDPELLQPVQAVRINEIAWMGVSGNQYGEWLELYNGEDSSVNLAGWTLVKDGETMPIFTFTKEIAAHGYLVVERTTDSHLDPLDEINDEAGSFAGGGLTNLPGGEHLVLQDAFGRIVADLDFSAGWPAGDNDSKETMQWIAGAWTTARGTPGAENMITVQGTAAQSATYPTFTDVLTRENVMQIKPDIKDDFLTEDAGVLDLADIKVFRVSEQDHVYVGFANASEKTQNISGLVLSVDTKKFILPKQTLLLPHAQIIIGTEKARFIGRAFSVFFGDTELALAY